MAVTPLSVTTLDSVTAVVIAASPGVAANATDGNSIANGGRTLLTMNNTGGSTYYVDVYVANPVDGNVVTPKRHSIAAGVIKRVLLGKPGIYGDTTLVKAENVAVKLLAEAV